MTIAKKGYYSLRTKTFLGKHIYKTTDIEICKDTGNGTSVYTIADFVKDGDSYCLRSCGNRLLEAIDNIEDLENIKELTNIGILICDCDETYSGHKADLGGINNDK